MNVKNVVHVIIGLEKGGAETMLFNFLIHEKKNKDYRFTVISLTKSGYYGKLLQACGIEVYEIGLDSVIQYPAKFVLLYKLIKSINPAIVQTWMYHADLFGGIVAKFLKIPKIIWTVHTVYLDKNTSLATKITKYLCGFFSCYIPTKILYVAEASRIHHLEYGYCDKVAETLPNGFKISTQSRFYQPAKHIDVEFNIFKDKFNVVTIGRYHNDKGIKNLLNTAKIVSNRNKSILFHLVGRMLDKSNAELVEIIENLGVADIIILHGMKENVIPFYTNSDLFCLPSKTEAFPLVLGEAMSMGLPSISTDVGDAKVLLGNDNYVVEPENPEQLAEMIIEFSMKKNDELKAIGESLKLRIYENYSIDRYSDRMHSIYSNID